MIMSLSKLVKLDAKVAIETRFPRFSNSLPIYPVNGNISYALQNLILISFTVQFSSLQSLSHVRLFATPWIAARQAHLSITNSWVHSDSCPLSQWCHPAISSSVIHFSSGLQSLPASESFPMSQLFASGGQSIGASASILVLPMNI